MKKIKRIFKSLFCKHKYIVFVRNIYGDEIDKISLKYIFRSKWRCKCCGKIVYKDKLYPGINDSVCCDDKEIRRKKYEN